MAKGTLQELRTTCATDVTAWCAADRPLLDLLAKHPEPASDQLMEHVLTDCLARHHAEVSTACAQALASAQAAAKAPIQHADNRLDVTGIGINMDQDQDAQAPIAPVLPVDKVPAPVPVGPAVQIVPDQRMDANALQEEGVEVRVFFINHRAAANAATPYLRVGGEAAQFAGPHPTAASMTLTPWLGILMFPFFAFGLYMAVVRGMTYWRRRRDVLYQVRSSSSSVPGAHSNEYQSIPTSKLLSFPPVPSDPHGH